MKNMDVNFMYEIYGVKVYSFTPDYAEGAYSLGKKLLGFALPELKKIFIRTGLYGKDREKVKKHELWHVFRPYDDELTTRARTDTLDV